MVSFAQLSDEGRNNALPCHGSGMGFLCWSVLASVSQILCHSDTVTGIICLERQTDKMKLSLWLPGEGENTCLECAGWCFKQMLLAVIPEKSVERC